MTVTIRAATAADVDQIAQINVATWQSTYRGVVSDDVLDRMSVEECRTRWLEIIREADDTAAQVLVAEQNHAVAGYCGFGPNRDVDPVHDAELRAVYVSPAVQRAGIGRLMFDAATRSLHGAGFKSMLVWVLTENPCRKFYEAMSGRPAGDREITIGGDVVAESAYAWNLAEVVERIAGRF